MSKKILVLGASGMLGNALFKYFLKKSYDVYGTVRDMALTNLYPEFSQAKIRVWSYPENIRNLIAEINPDVVINCIGIIKQHSDRVTISDQISINSLLPHLLSDICKASGSRLIQISTDCVFSGNRGMYSEDDVADANDIYGRTKWLGEIVASNAITVRTSIIGHELRGHYSLIDWFLAQDISIRGYRNAIFSGLPTNELARVICEYVIPNLALQGIYHVSSDPISKFDLLKLVADEYGKKIEIIEDDSLRIDRSLDSSKFKAATGFSSKPWLELVHSMHRFG